MLAPISVHTFQRITTKAQAEAIAGSLSTPSKMPGYGYGLSAKDCKIGAKLAKVPGSVCSSCYALKGNYRRDNVTKAHYKRLRSLPHPQWVDAMVFMIGRAKSPWFRWHDSGDLQSLWHLENICEVARRLPNVRFWLPTREKALVQAHSKMFGVPNNLVIRVSAAMIDGKPPAAAHTSTVVSSGASCPARTRGNVCGSCRDCWDPYIKNVSYEVH